MKRRKVMISAAAAAAAALPLGGCGKEKGGLDSENPVTIEVHTYYNGAHKIAFDELEMCIRDSIWNI